jgi:hypothetical protein
MTKWLSLEGGLVAGKFVTFEIRLHMLFYRYSVLKEAIFSKAESARYPPVLLLRRGRGQSNRCFRYSFGDSDGCVVRFTGCRLKICSVSHDVKRWVDELVLWVLLSV